MKRTYYKTYSVTCPAPNCPQPADEFLVRYEVEDNGGVKKLIGRRAIEDVEMEAQALTPNKEYGSFQHPCPWCRVFSIFTVPL